MKNRLLVLCFIICTHTVNAQYTNLLSFSGPTNGLFPYGSLISDGTFLYGMTSEGGTNNMGTIFKILPNGTGYVNLLNFTGANGRYPFGSLISDGTFLYGMTSGGGTNNMGTIFKILPNGTGYVNLLNFAGAVNGSFPNATLVSDGTFLYGTTQNGGINNLGTIFKILPDGTGYVKLLDFAGAVNGSYPLSSLIYDGTFLYGMTTLGGTNNYGAIFKILPDGTGYVNLLDFAGVANGRNPYGSLISDGTFLYGMTSGGGANNVGTMFKILPNGTGYVNLLDFAGATNGRAPHGSLIYDGTFLYGMTTEGGTNDLGTIFKILPNGTGYVNLLNFVGANGSYPEGSLIYDGTFLYGMTFAGGTNNFGTVFKYQYCTAATFTQSPTVCLGESITVGANTYTVSGTYTDTLDAITTCDSIVITNLTVLPANTFSQSPTICTGQSITVGTNSYSASGTYTDTLTALSTCDSIVTTILTVNPMPVLTTSLSALTITADQIGATYQWINCTNNTVIAGEISQSYTTTSNGSYAVIVTLNGCTDTSECISISAVGINEIQTSVVSVYPNPTTGQLILELNTNAHLHVTDVLGKPIMYMDAAKGKQMIDLTGNENGVYYLIIDGNQSKEVKKITISK